MRHVSRYRSLFGLLVCLYVYLSINSSLFRNKLGGAYFQPAQRLEPTTPRSHLAPQATARPQKAVNTPVIPNHGHPEATRLNSGPVDTNGTPMCNVTAFQEQLDLDSEIPVVPVHLLSGCVHIFNNRVPKTGSRIFIQVIDRITEKRHMKHIFFVKDKYEARFTTNHTKVLLEQVAKGNNRFILTEHMYYFDFRQYFPHTVVNINVIREPVEWYMSLFNFCKYTLGARTSIPDCMVDIKSCVNGEHPDNGMCITFGYDNSALHYLCGDAAECQSRSESSLATAKRRLEKDYLVVGLTESLPEYFEVLEFLMPHVFKGSSRMYVDLTPKFKNMFVSGKKEEVDLETREMLKAKLKLDYELYDAAAARFQKLLQAVRYFKHRADVIKIQE